MFDSVFTQAKNAKPHQKPLKSRLSSSGRPWHSDCPQSKALMGHAARQAQRAEREDGVAKSADWRREWHPRNLLGKKSQTGDFFL